MVGIVPRYNFSINPKLPNPTKYLPVSTTSLSAFPGQFKIIANDIIDDINARILYLFIFCFLINV